MEALDWTLGAVELALVVASLAWLLSALRGPSRRRLSLAAAAAALAALTLAQPFGLVATESEAPPGDATRVDSQGVHVARVLGGVPLLPFVLYRRDDLGPRVAESTAEASLRARSWLWLPAVANAASVSELCSGEVSLPCWAPEDAGSLYQDTLAVYERDGEFWAVVANPNSEQYAPGTPAAFTWKLDAGITSSAGLVYWVVAGILVLLAYRRLRGQAARAS